MMDFVFNFEIYFYKPGSEGNYIHLVLRRQQFSIKRHKILNIGLNIYNDLLLRIAMNHKLHSNPVIKSLLRQG